MVAVIGTYVVGRTQSNTTSKAADHPQPSTHFYSPLLLLQGTTYIMSEDPCSQQLLVDFPTHRRPSVRFASTDTVHPIRSTLTMISHKEELWYSKSDEITMKTQMRIDAITLRRTSAEDLKEEGGGLHVSQMVGLEALVVGPAQAQSK